MRSVFESWDRVAVRLKNASQRLLLFDFDGTLVPIRSHAEEVYLPPKTQRLLQALAAQPRCTVGIVSGRALQDLRKRVGVQGLLYVGNHGFEIQRGPDVFIHPSANAKSGILRNLAEAITSHLKGIKGVRVENKGYTLSIHYRHVAPGQISCVQETVRTLVRERTVPGALFLKNGKMAIEIRPERMWHKGSAVHLLRRSEPAGTCVLYVGDDSTDEDVFRILSREDISVHIGPGLTQAQYVVRGPMDVRHMLKRLIRMAEE